VIDRSASRFPSGLAVTHSVDYDDDYDNDNDNDNEKIWLIRKRCAPSSSLG